MPVPRLKGRHTQRSVARRSSSGISALRNRDALHRDRGERRAHTPADAPRCRSASAARYVRVAGQMAKSLALRENSGSPRGPRKIWVAVLAAESPRRRSAWAGTDRRLKRYSGPEGDAPCHRAGDVTYEEHQGRSLGGEIAEMRFRPDEARPKRFRRRFVLS